VSHTLFECPAYHEDCTEYAELFTAGHAMAQFLGQAVGRVAPDTGPAAGGRQQAVEAERKRGSAGGEPLPEGALQARLNDEANG
jgi:hypothetical protein